MDRDRRVLCGGRPEQTCGGREKKAERGGDMPDGSGNGSAPVVILAAGGASADDSRLLFPAATAWLEGLQKAAGSSAVTAGVLTGHRQAGPMWLTGPGPAHIFRPLSSPAGPGGWFPVLPSDPTRDASGELAAHAGPVATSVGAARRAVRFGHRTTEPPTMRIQVTGKQIDVGAGLRQRVEQRLADGVAKYFGSGIEAHVGFSRVAALVRADCSVRIGHGIHVQSHATADQAAQSFEAACDRLEKRLRRYKRRLRDHHAKPRPAEPLEQAPSYVLAPEPEDAPEPENDFQPVVVAESTTDIHRLSVGEAVMRLDLADAPVLVFRNAANGRPNVVYRRGDGHIGWIDLPVAPQS